MNTSIPPRLWKIVTPISPFAHQADEHTATWAHCHRLTRSAEAERRLAATRPGLLAAHCYPSADRSDLCLIADWMSWLFLLDDQNDEGSLSTRPDDLEHVLVDMYRSAVGDQDRAMSPLAKALRDICDRVAGRMPEVWNYRFQCHIMEYLTACVQQSAHRAEGVVPDLDAFVPMRRHAGAIMPSFDLIEFVEHGVLPARLYYSHTYQRLLDAAADIVCWTNDIMTFDKERARGDFHNLVSVLMNAGHAPLATATDCTATSIDERIQQFTQTEAGLSGPCAETDFVGRCVALLRAWVRGHVEWGFVTARYLEIDRTPAEPAYLEDLHVQQPVR